MVKPIKELTFEQLIMIRLRYEAKSNYCHAYTYAEVMKELKLRKLDI